MPSRTLEETVRIIIDASARLKCSVETRTRALLIYHHFKRCVHEVEYDPHLVAAACLSISITYTEEPIKFASVILVFFSIVDGSNAGIASNEKFKIMCKSVQTMQFLILRMIEFTLNHILPFGYLKCLMFNLRESLVVSNLWDSFVETSMKVASDFYFTARCLTYKPEQIAASAVKASLYLLGVNTDVDDCYLQNWIKGLGGADGSTEHLLINDICETYSEPESDKKQD